MARTLSANFRRALYAQETGEVVVCLLEIYGSGMDAPIRVCDDAVSTWFGGNEFVSFPFEMVLNDSREDAPPKASLRIDNVDQRVMEAVRSLEGEVTVTARWVLASAPDQVEIGPLRFTLGGVEADELSIDGTLAFEDLLNEPFPSDAYTPSRFPGLFA